MSELYNKLAAYQEGFSDDLDGQSFPTLPDFESPSTDKVELVNKVLANMGKSWSVQGFANARFKEERQAEIRAAVMKELIPEIAKFNETQGGTLAFNDKDLQSALVAKENQVKAEREAAEQAKKTQPSQTNEAERAPSPTTITQTPSSLIKTVTKPALPPKHTTSQAMVVKPAIDMVIGQSSLADIQQSCTILGIDHKKLFKEFDKEKTAEIVVNAYKKAALNNHPDRKGNTSAIQDVNNARDLLNEFIENPQKFQNNQIPLAIMDANRTNAVTAPTRSTPIVNPSRPLAESNSAQHTAFDFLNDQIPAAQKGKNVEITVNSKIDRKRPSTANIANTTKSTHTADFNAFDSIQDSVLSPLETERTTPTIATPLTPEEMIQRFGSKGENNSNLPTETLSENDVFNPLHQPKYAGIRERSEFKPTEFKPYKYEEPAASNTRINPNAPFSQKKPTINLDPLAPRSAVYTKGIVATRQAVVKAIMNGGIMEDKKKQQQDASDQKKSFIPSFKGMKNAIVSAISPPITSDKSITPNTQMKGKTDKPKKNSWSIFR